jgi:hypothetical protein
MKAYDGVDVSMYGFTALCCRVLGRGSARPKAATYTQNNTNTE